MATLLPQMSEPIPQKKRILALDGGGIRGVFSIEILARIEELLRQHYGRPQMVLADHFDLIAGTSTGGIIGSFLSWGEPVDRVRKLYEENAGAMFCKAPWWKLRGGLFDAANLSAFLREFFVEENGTLSTMGTARLKTILLLVMRNASTGSAWPVTNHPGAKYNARVFPDGTVNSECNLDFPLWQLVRASAAAPVYFPPEHVELGGRTHSFIDGGITAYNNPALIAYLMATLPCYGMSWPQGEERMQVVSIGTGITRAKVSEFLRRYVNALSYAAVVPSGLMESISKEQDMLCRILGRCLHGGAIDSEMGDLIDAAGDKNFTYVRFNREFNQKEILAVETKYGGKFALDNLKMRDYLIEVGREYSEHVQLSHLI
jgi:hypothetical protein